MPPRIDRIANKHLTAPDQHPRFKPRFTPTTASWAKLVERFFAGGGRCWV